MIHRWQTLLIIVVIRKVRNTGKMPFKRTVEIGRVAMVNYGSDYGKLYVISDVLDLNKVNSCVNSM